MRINLLEIHGIELKEGNNQQKYEALGRFSKRLCNKNMA